MRYLCPDACAGVTHAGAALTKDADGLIEAAEEDAAALAPHGLVPALEDMPAAKPRARNRTDDRRMLR